MIATIKHFIFFSCIFFLCAPNGHLWFYIFLSIVPLSICFFRFFFTPLTIDFIVVVKCYRLKYYSIYSVWICVLFLWCIINGLMYIVLFSCIFFLVLALSLVWFICIYLFECVYKCPIPVHLVILCVCVCLCNAMHVFNGLYLVQQLNLAHSSFNRFGEFFFTLLYHMLIVFVSIKFHVFFLFFFPGNYFITFFLRLNTIIWSKFYYSSSQIRIPNRMTMQMWDICTTKKTNEQVA